jgi:hypothetical protein
MFFIYIFSYFAQFINEKYYNILLVSYIRGKYPIPEKIYTTRYKYILDRFPGEEIILKNEEVNFRCEKEYPY